jgi:uncharacterized membrane protein HdeD (DUF308 family)
VDAARSFARKGNPLRADISWPVILIEGLVVGAIGVYALVSESSARRNLLFLIGAFLLIDGIAFALEHYRSRGANDPMTSFRLLRAGISIAVGLIVVFDRFVDFLDTNPIRVILGLGLIAIGLIALIGMFLTREETELRFGALISAILLGALGLLLLYQASEDTDSIRTLGWAAIIAGGGLIGVALYRRQRSRQDLSPATR